MSRPKKSNSAKNIQKKLKEGRGQGNLTNYLPWIFTTDFSSLGVDSRVLGSKIARIYHLLSELEHTAFCFYDLHPRVIDINEQFPLLPIEMTIQICENLGIKHPTEPGTQDLTVMTVDFLVTVAIDGTVRRLARDIKPKVKLREARTVQKLEISRRYFDALSINYGVMTQDELEVPIVKNSKLLQPHATEDGLPLSSKTRIRLRDYLIGKMPRNNRALRDICAEADEFLGHEPGTSLSIALHMIATHQWQIDWNTHFSPASPGSSISK